MNNIVPRDSNGTTVRRRIALFGVKYSSNLGDGIIADCLAMELEAAQPSLQIVPIDLAGRTKFDAASGARRRNLLAILEALPDFMRQRLVPIIIRSLVRWSIRPSWRKSIDDCEAAVIGGGALIADADQNFPIKLEAALNLCAAKDIPVAIAHVGVSKDWSRPGHLRLSQGLSRASVFATTFRDPASRDLFAEQFAFAGAPNPEVATDPGILSCEVYGPVTTARRAKVRTIGICVTNAMVLRLHGEGRHDARFLREWLHTVITGLLDKECHVVLFTNGSPEDEAEKDEIALRFERHAQVSNANRFALPSELALFIAGLDGIIAHRLHACIVAYSYSVPALGLSWDRKLNHFFEMVGQGELVLDPHAVSPFEAIRKLQKAIDDPPPPHEREAVLDDCRQGIESLAKMLVDATSDRERLTA